MKRNVLNMLMTATLLLTLAGAYAQNQKRYIDEMFAAADPQTNIMYDSNFAINLLYGKAGLPSQFTSSPVYMAKLLCDVYTPANDAETKRPLIILAHTGSYLPPYLNGQPTGNKEDSTIKEIAKKFAMRGYVVAAINYRIGWNPATTIQEQATEQLIKATYRALQDTRRAIQYFRKNYTMYGIDTNRIAVGGQGTGGYIALAMATVSKKSDLESNPKFLRSDATPMVNSDTLGDWLGNGGLIGYNLPTALTNKAGVSADFNIAFNYGGAMGDTAWMKSTSKPMVSVHCTRDPFAPYKTGNVVVPTTKVTVIPNASGGGDVIPKANTMGLNDFITKNYNYKDAVSMRAMQVPGAVNHLFGLETAYPAEGSPWEWWDTAVAANTTTWSYRGLPLPLADGAGRKASSDGLLTNPYMSATRARMYCDSIVRFISPRLAVQFGYINSLSVNEINYNNKMSVYPNPATNNIFVSMDRSVSSIDEVNILDITGKLIINVAGVNASEKNIEINNLNKGIYLVNVLLSNGAKATSRLIVE